VVVGVPNSLLIDLLLIRIVSSSSNFGAETKGSFGGFLLLYEDGYFSS
jgi:hypothetical protein